MVAARRKLASPLRRPLGATHQYKQRPQEVGRQGVPRGNQGCKVAFPLALALSRRARKRVCRYLASRPAATWNVIGSVPSYSRFYLLHRQDDPGADRKISGSSKSLRDNL